MSFGGFSFGSPSYGIFPTNNNPSTPTIAPTFGTDWPSIVQTAVADGLKVYSTVAANQIAGQQVANGGQPTALFIPQQYAANPGSAASQLGGTGLLSAFTPGTWLLILGVIVLLFLFKK